MTLNKIHEKLMRADHKLLALRPDLISQTIAKEAGKIANASFNLSLLDVLDNLAKLAMRNEPMPWEAIKYPDLPRYVLETDYGCYSDYGWTIANTNEDLDEGKRQYEHWSKTNGLFRLVDGRTGEVILPAND